jgi:hypothetical protein
MMRCWKEAHIRMVSAILLASIPAAALLLGLFHWLSHFPVAQPLLTTSLTQRSAIKNEEACDGNAEGPGHRDRKSAVG